MREPRRSLVILFVALCMGFLRDPLESELPRPDEEILLGSWETEIRIGSTLTRALTEIGGPGGEQVTRLFVGSELPAQLPSRWTGRLTRQDDRIRIRFDLSNRLSIAEALGQAESWMRGEPKEEHSDRSLFIEEELRPTARGTRWEGTWRLQDGSAMGPTTLRRRSVALILHGWFFHRLLARPHHSFRFLLEAQKVAAVYGRKGIPAETRAAVNPTSLVRHLEEMKAQRSEVVRLVFIGHGGPIDGPIYGWGQLFLGKQRNMQIGDVTLKHDSMRDLAVLLEQVLAPDAQVILWSCQQGGVDPLVGRDPHPATTELFEELTGSGFFPYAQAFASLSGRTTFGPLGRTHVKYAYHFLRKYELGEGPGAPQPVLRFDPQPFRRNP